MIRLLATTALGLVLANAALRNRQAATPSLSKRRNPSQFRSSVQHVAVWRGTNTAVAIAAAAIINARSVDTEYPGDHSVFRIGQFRLRDQRHQQRGHVLAAAQWYGKLQRGR